MLLAVLTCLAAALLPSTVHALPYRVYVNETVNAYVIFNRTLGGAAIEAPDCSHTESGLHIQLVDDKELGRRVFAFYMHVDEDDDRCVAFDRQRNEIKTYNPSPAYLKINRTETAVYSWNFKLEKGVQMTPEFFHIHQLKFVGGNDSMPLYTLSLEKNYLGENTIRYVYWPWNDRWARIDLVEEPIGPFEDTWVHVYERVTFDHHASIFFEITRISDGKVLLHYSNNDIDNWRDDTGYCRPKWGIYRSLLFKEQLRNETIYFDRFCLAKELTQEDFCDRRELLCEKCHGSDDSGSPGRVSSSAAVAAVVYVAVCVLQALRQ